MRNHSLFLAIVTIIVGLASNAAMAIDFDTYNYGDVNLTCKGVKAAVVVGFNSLVCRDEQTKKKYFVDIYSAGASYEFVPYLEMHINCQPLKVEGWTGIWDHVWVRDANSSRQHISDRIGYTYQGYVARKTREYKENFEGWYSAFQAGFGVGYARPAVSGGSSYATPNNYDGDGLSYHRPTSDGFSFSNSRGYCEFDSRGLGVGFDLSYGAMWIRSVDRKIY